MEMETTTTTRNNNNNTTNKLERKEEKMNNEQRQQQIRNKKKINNEEEKKNPWSNVGGHNFADHIVPEVADPYTREASPELKITYALKATKKIKDSNSKAHPIL